MAGLNFDVSGARQAGYSDAEIVSHLADTKSGFDVPGALKAGYSPTEILSHLAPPQSGIIDNFQQGASEALSGVGSTIKNYVGNGYGGDTLESAGKAIAPANFVPSPIVDKDGFHPSNILRSLARATPGAAAAIGAAALAPEALGAAGPIAMATGAGTLMSAGPAAQQAAASRTGNANATPNTADLTRGGLTSLASSAVQAVPVSRFLKPGAGSVASGVIANTGAKGVGDAVKNLVSTAADQGLASGASNAIGQVGQTVGTPGGVQVDPVDALNATATGGMSGALFAGRPALRQSLDAMKFSAITPDLKPAAIMVANRIAQAADGRNLQGSTVSSAAAQRAGEDSMVKTRAGISSELHDAVSSLTTPLSTDTQNILNAAKAGNMPTPGDYAKLKAAVASDPQGPNVVNLVQQAHAMNVFDSMGNHTNGKFTGGGSGALGKALTPEHVMKTGLIAAMGGEAGHLIGFSPEMLATAAGGTVAARFLDNVTGQQAPAGRIVRNFADGQTPVRLPATPPPAVAPNNAPQAPMGGPPRPWSSPQAMAAILAAKRAGPAPVAPAPTPGGAPLAGGPGASPMIPPAVAAQMSARANIAKLIAAKQSAQQTQTVQQALPLLRTLAERQGPNAKALELPADFTKTLTNPGAPAAPGGAAPAPAAPPEPAINPLALPSSITGPAKALMRGASIAQKMKTDAIGQDAAKAEVNASPFIDQKVGGAANLPSPAAAKYMSAAVRGVGVLAKLKSDPEAEAEDKAQAKADAAAEKQKVKDAAKAAAAPPSVTISKANGQTKVGDEPFAPSSYAQYPPDVAARAITKAAGDTVKFPANHTASVKTRIQGERNIMARIGAEVPGLPIADLTARLEGRTDQTDAKAYREHLKTLFPQAAPVIDKHLSDGAIESLWSRKSAPKKK